MQHDGRENVLLLMVSLRRGAQAQREIAARSLLRSASRRHEGLSGVGVREAAAARRARGQRRGEGRVHHTVLTEGDDPNEPVADAARAVLDARVVLSRQLAESGLYPAIDIEAPISRLTSLVTTPVHQQLIRRFRQLNATYAQNRDLITIGAYAKGGEPRVDEGKPAAREAMP